MQKRCIYGGGSWLLWQLDILILNYGLVFLILQFEAMNCISLIYWLSPTISFNKLDSSVESLWGLSQILHICSSLNSHIVIKSQRSF